jgi:hypothetical protein
MPRLLRHAAVFILIAGALSGCDLIRPISVHSTQAKAQREAPCVRRILTRPTGNC